MITGSSTTLTNITFFKVMVKFTVFIYIYFFMKEYEGNQEYGAAHLEIQVCQVVPVIQVLLEVREHSHLDPAHLLHLLDPSDMSINKC